MRFATIIEDGRASLAVVHEPAILPVSGQAGLSSMRGLAAAGHEGLERLRAWVARQPEAAYRSPDGVEFGPAVPDPGAIFTIGLNYAPPDGQDLSRPDRPLVYGKLPTSVTGHGATLGWDRAITANVDAECELGVVIGTPASAVAASDAMRHVFGYTVINDVSSRDPWLDGDQWLLGKSMAGFCPIGPWVVTADELDPSNLRLGCRINGIAIQDGSSAQMRFSIAEVIAFLSRHVELRTGDLIATGTPARLDGPLGPDRHLEAGDVVTAWIEGIGELTTIIA